MVLHTPFRQIYFDCKVSKELLHYIEACHQNWCSHLLGSVFKMNIDNIFSLGAMFPQNN